MVGDMSKLSQFVQTLIVIDESLGLFVRKLKISWVSRSMGLSIVIALAVGMACYFVAQAYVVKRAEKNIGDVLLTHRATNHYLAEVARPAIAALQSEGRLQKDIFVPELMSGSYIVRRQHQYFKKERERTGRQFI